MSKLFRIEANVGGLAYINMIPRQVLGQLVEYRLSPYCSLCIEVEPAFQLKLWLEICNSNQFENLDSSIFSSLSIISDRLLYSLYIISPLKDWNALAKRLATLLIRIFFLKIIAGDAILYYTCFTVINVYTYACVFIYMEPYSFSFLSFRLNKKRKKVYMYRDEGDHRCYCCCRKGDHYRFLVRLERAERKTRDFLFTLWTSARPRIIFFYFFSFTSVCMANDKRKRKNLTNTFTLCYRSRRSIYNCLEISRVLSEPIKSNSYI